jgi:hypothetical protein
MNRKHNKIFYTGGLISLIILPILAYLFTSDSRGKAVKYSSIEIIMPPEGLDVEVAVKTYNYSLRSNESAQIDSFNRYCTDLHIREIKSSFLLQIYLPENCDYNLVVQLLDILNDNNFNSYFSKRSIKAFHCRQPYMNHTQTYMLLLKEFEKKPFKWYYSLSYYAKQMYNSIMPSDKKSILTYTIEGSPEAYLKELRENEQHILLIDTLGAWFYPIIIVWILLFILSIRRNMYKVLPANQALKLTE